MSSHYYRVHFKNLFSVDVDALSSFCFEFGASGVEEPLRFAQDPALMYEPTVIETKQTEVYAYFEDAPHENLISFISEKFPGIQAQIFKEESQDWLSEWKKGFFPFRLAGPYWVVPSWLPVPEEAERPLRIDPGMAFGTGTHATTQLAAEMLFGVTQKPSNGFTVLDVGTGSGILSIMAHLQGASKTVATDNDPEAVRVALENASLNGIEGIQIKLAENYKYQEKFDIVIANIIDGVLIQLKDELIQSLRPGGKLILSGVLEEREGLFLPEFLDQTTLKIQQKLQRDGWLSYILQFAG